MTYTDVRVQELLSRNLWLKKQQKVDILNGTEQTKQDILPLLEEMDVKLMKLFRAVTAKNPKFFDGLFDTACEEAEKNGTPVDRALLQETVKPVDPMINEQQSRFLLTILAVFKSEKDIPEDRELSGAEQQYFFSLYKQWVSSVSENDPRYRDRDRMNADYETLGIITNKRHYDYAKLQKAVKFIVQHEAEEPDFQGLCKHLNAS